MLSVVGALSPKSIKMHKETAVDTTTGKEHKRPSSMPNCSDVVE